MILRQIERLQRSRRIDRLVVATSVDVSDDPLATLVDGAGLDVHRGSLDDVLDRFITAATAYEPAWVVRLTGDCPLADPRLIDQVIEATVNASSDYGSNTIEPTYPDGLDVEVIRYHVLKDIWRTGGSSAEREHVTLGIYRHPERYRLLSFKNELDLSALRWTVDELPDLLFIERVYAELYPSTNLFETDDILALLAKQPELVALNAGIRRNEGLAKSLAAERSSPGPIPKDIAK